MDTSAGKHMLQLVGVHFRKPQPHVRVPLLPLVAQCRLRLLLPRNAADWQPMRAILAPAVVVTAIKGLRPRAIPRSLNLLEQGCRDKHMTATPCAMATCHAGGCLTPESTSCAAAGGLRAAYISLGSTWPCSHWGLRRTREPRSSSTTRLSPATHVRCDQSMKARILRWVAAACAV